MAGVAGRHYYLLQVILLLQAGIALLVLGNPHRHGGAHNIERFFDRNVDPSDSYELFNGPDYGRISSDNTYDYGLLPGEVETYRNVLMDIMDMLDEGDQQVHEKPQKRKRKNKKKKKKRKGRKCRGKKCRDQQREQAISSPKEKEDNDMVVVVVEGNDDNPLDVSLASLTYYPPDMWSKCTRSCLTRRFRKCKFPELCGKEKLKEEAFCYAPGSTCQDKVQLLLQEEGYIIVDEEQLQIGQDHNNIGEGEDEMGQGEHPKGYDQHDYDYEDSTDYGEQSEEHIVDIGEHVDSSDGQTYEYYDEVVDYDNENNQIWVPGDYDNYIYYDTEEENSSEYKPDGFDYDYIFIVPDDFVEYNENHEDHPEEDYDYSWSDYITGGKIEYDYDNLDDKDQSISTDSEESPEMPSEYAQNEDIDEDLAAQCGKASVRSRSNFLRIIGGREAVAGEFPWQVAVLNRFKEVFCGGVVIAPQWILTAAHCIRKKLYVRLAEHDIRDYEGRELEIKVQKMFKHPDYDLETIENDIALLKLPKKVQLGKHIRQICLPAQAAPPPIGNKCIIAGWGKERESHIFGSDVLNYAKVPIVSRKVCRAAYPEHPITRNHVCAGYKRGNIDSCAGDSGGPLLCKGEDGLWSVHGVTSFGEGCGETGKFGVYTKVANYIHWIRKTMKENVT